MGMDDLTLTQNLIDFIADSPVCFSVIQNMSRLLDENGFQKLERSEKVNKGGRYYTTRNGSSLIAFSLPENKPNGFMLTASHGDSPLFKLKRNYSIKACDRYLKLDTESYGGGIFSSWFDRPLSLAGRLVVRDGGRLNAVPFSIDRDICIIPNTCIHFNRDLNNGYKFNPSVDTLPLAGEWDDESGLADLICDYIGVDKKNVVSSDIYVYSRMKGTVFGIRNEFFASPRIDDQQCAYLSMRAFLDAEKSHSIPMCCVFDNEEVGSSTKQGAASDFLKETVDSISETYGIPASSLLGSSLMLSCDNAHAMHPNHPELSNAKNAPHMNAGIVIKHNANQKYTTDAVSEALFTEICAKASVPVQHFSNRSDLVGGSTLGSIASARVSMNTVDIGLAQLAMHSSCETAGTRDSKYFYDALRVFFNSSILCEKDGVYRFV